MRSCYVIIFTCLVAACHSQPQQAMVSDPKFDETIRNYLSFSVPVIECQELVQNVEDYVLLDAREEKEYEISHIRHARHVGFDKFDLATVADLAKDTPIVVYCSIGYRSEKIGEKLLNDGFTNVKNLYGSIFEWVNQNNPVHNAAGPIDAVHTYNKKWGKWVSNPEIKKATQ